MKLSAMRVLHAQIRRAKNFIYIENQYFIGSSHMWEQAIGASDNIVPAEIAVKICDKIRAGTICRQ
jgi:phospholipase D1/2